MGKKLNLTYQQIGHLYIQAPIRLKNGTKGWECLCDCGKVVNKSTQDLRQTSHKHQKRRSLPSCGCKNNKGGIFNAKYAPKESSYRSLALRYKTKAKSRQITWNLSDSNARSLFVSNCYYCGQTPLQDFNRFCGSLTKKKTQGITDQRVEEAWIKYNGIDRIDSTQGYIPGNVVPCCKWCNYAKSDRTIEEFILWGKKLSCGLEVLEKHNGT